MSVEELVESRSQVDLGDDAAVVRLRVARLVADLEAAMAKAAQLETALQSARTIGCAMGIIMAMDLVTQREAFDVLREASQRQNRKLREIADDVVLAGALDDYRRHLACS